MPRASRVYTPGHFWHITHRCHDREFHLRFDDDRSRWIRLLSEARRRYRLHILNYTVTHNHVHLIAFDKSKDGAISRGMQFVASQTAQRHNERRDRHGAFWQDRYHATAVESGRHLINCLLYVDLNMVRAGVVKHPSQWPHGGHNEILTPRERYRVIDHGLLLKLFGVGTHQQMVDIYMNALDEALAGPGLTRSEVWSRSVAVGSELFVTAMQRELGAREKVTVAQPEQRIEAPHKALESAGGVQEPQAHYGADLGDMYVLDGDNTVAIGDISGSDHETII